MIKIFKDDKAWEFLNEKKKSVHKDPKVTKTVAEIINKVKKDGDKALIELSKKFGEEPGTIKLSEEEVKSAINNISAPSKSILEKAAKNIESYADAVIKNIRSFTLEREGWSVGIDYKPVESVGCYVPGGRYPLPSTALMTAITAKIAGVEKISITSPKIQNEIVFAGKLAGVDTFYKLGGAQAVAALALGTKTVKATDMIVGPGNIYVTEAKKQLQGIVGIDMLAGPSEVLIIADKNSNPEWIALDLMAQLEHDPEANGSVLTDDAKIAETIKNEVEKITKEKDLPNFIKDSISKQVILVFENLESCAEASDTLAPEHLVLHIENPGSLRKKLKHYGALFMGRGATVPFGDYMAGPNHTLPTGKTARYKGGLTPLTFLRPQSWFEWREGSRELAENTALFAEMEGLKMHALAAKSRNNK
jgi:histidinol dehydrogenase